MESQKVGGDEKEKGVNINILDEDEKGVHTPTFLQIILV